MTYRLGLTGGIATGKSTVSALFAKAGYPVVDADQIARAIVAPGQPALAAIVAYFGETVLLPDGQLNRKALGQLVFADKQALAALNRINKPYLRQAIVAALDQAAKSGKKIVVGDIPLLFEGHFTEYFDGIAVVTVPYAVQLERLMARDHLEEAAAKQRIEAQMPLAKKVAQADFVIDNSHGQAAREQQVMALIHQLAQ